MNYCPSCGSELRSKAKYCPKCGKQLQLSASRSAGQQNNSGTSRRTLFKTVAITGVLILGGYLLYSTLSPTVSSSSAEKILKEATGTYFDRTGVVTGSLDSDVQISSSDGELVGRTNSGKLHFNLSIVGYDRFYGNVTLDGIDAIHTANYDDKLKRLTFSNELTGSTWYIQKRR